MLLQHDKARPHTSAAVSAAIESIRSEIVPHPPYSLDLVLSEFWLFAALKQHLEGIHFICDEEVQATMGK
jgi:transposase